MMSAILRHVVLSWRIYSFISLISSYISQPVYLVSSMCTNRLKLFVHYLKKASNAYLRFLLGPATEMLFEFVNKMPKLETQIKIDLASVLGPLFFTLVILQLLPVILTSLVYEKQQKLRIMMKMHGLGTDPYWMITYAYFLVIYLAYMLCFVLFGSVIVVGYIMVFGSGLTGGFLFQCFVEIHHSQVFRSILIVQSQDDELG